MPDPEWSDTVRDLAGRRERSRAMGGEDRLAKHRAAGKLDARARIDTLLDPGSFREFGTLVGGEVPADAFVAGGGTIAGRHVMVGAEDFTTLAGTIAHGSNSKRYRLAELALRTKVPLVMLLEGAGFRPTETVGARYPTDLLIQAQCSGKIPMVTGVLGASAGHGALIAPISDFTVMSQQAAIFTAGPPVVRASTGEDITKEDLGGPPVATASGLVHNTADDDAGVLVQIRRYLSYFPSSAWSYPPCNFDGEDVEARPTPEIMDVVPRDNRRVYDMRLVVESVVDTGEWFEIQPGFGRSMLCGLAHLGGQPVAVVANQPQVLAGSIDAAAADKAAHFIAVADAFHLPLVFLSDNPGVLPGSQSERAGVLRSGARMFAAQTLATTPKVHVTLRKAYGFGSMVMAMVSFDQQVATFAYPGATLGAMGTAAASSAMKASEELTAEMQDAELRASYHSAEWLGFDELIHPQETRTMLIQALEQALYVRQLPAEPRHLSAITP
jgi:acetyl-CoA carboxylase carboxyltransferase component